MKITNNKKKTLEKALDELFEARKLFRALRSRIGELNHIVEKSGGFPEVNARIARNKQIYKKWKDGMNYAQLGREFNLTNTTISNICNRIDRSLEKKTPWSKKYKGLQKYK